MAIAVHARTNGAAPAVVPPVTLDHEQLAVRRGDRSGLYCVVAIHSTALGPALGGLRIWHYPDPSDALRDALRLAAGMTLKAAAAELDLGGGKGVIYAPPEGLEGERRRAALLDFADLVESLGGSYVTAEDVGTTPDDLVAISERTAHLTGLPPERGGSGDPSPFTAIGVEAAIRSCARDRLGARELTGVHVAIAGLGHVGAVLAQRLAEAGCELTVADIDPVKRELASRLGASWVDPALACEVECDVFAPCALGGAIDVANVEALDCAVVCGSANNQLADDSLAVALDARGILYAPDFIANAGGLIHVYREIKGYSEERAVALAHGIEATMDRVLETAHARAIPPLDAARELADERLDAALRD